MKTFTYTTGRDYGGPQILEISFEEPSPEADDFDNVLVDFNDQVRGIKGRVKLFVLEIGQYDIGRAVLGEYDACRYYA